MIATLIAACLAILMALTPTHLQEGGTIGAMPTMMNIFSLLFLFAPFMTYLFAWTPLQKVEQNQVPHVVSNFLRDRWITLQTGWVLLFALASFSIASTPLYRHAVQHWWFFPAWIILLGLTIDALVGVVKKITEYLDPSANVKALVKATKYTHEEEVCYAIDTLAEVGMKGIKRYSMALVNTSIDEQVQLVKLFLATTKKTERVTYTLFYLYQRLDALFMRALDKHLEPTCSLIMTAFGKLALATAHYDMTLAGAPLRFLGKCATKAREAELEETMLAASCVLFQVAEQLLTEIDVSSLTIKDPFLSIINSMEVAAKETFRKNKESNIGLLIQPFRDLKKLIEKETLRNHPDTSILLQNIDRILGEFEALYLVMKTAPPIPSSEEKHE